MFKLDYITKEGMKLHNPHWSEIPDQPHRILILGVLELEKQMHYLI